MNEATFLLIELLGSFMDNIYMYICICYYMHMLLEGSSFVSNYRCTWLVITFYVLFLMQIIYKTFVCRDNYLIYIDFLSL